MNAARKAQEKHWALLLSTTIAAIKNREIELRRPVTDDEVIEVLRRGIKSRRESVEQYTAAKRMDLADQEAAEIRMLEAFLPPAIDPDEIRAAVKAAIAAGAGDIGKIMGQVMPQFEGRADGKQINAIVREELHAG